VFKEIFRDFVAEGIVLVFSGGNNIKTMIQPNVRDTRVLNIRPSTKECRMPAAYM
jgi:hypothetical protein